MCHKSWQTVVHSQNPSVSNGSDTETDSEVDRHLYEGIHDAGIHDPGLHDDGGEVDISESDRAETDPGNQTPDPFGPTKSHQREISRYVSVSD